MKIWFESTSLWLCERWDCLWSVKRNEPEGKLDKHWIDHINDK